MKPGTLSKVGDAIKELQARIAELEKALKPFADYASRCTDLAGKSYPDNYEIGPIISGTCLLTMGDCHRAKTALENK